MKIDADKIKVIVFISAGVIAAVIIGVMLYDFSGALKKLFYGVGLGASQTDKDITSAKKTALTANFFNPKYYQDTTQGKPMTLFPAQIDSLVSRLQNSISSILHDVNDGEIEAVFMSLANKCQVSQLAYYFNSKENTSLDVWLEEKLNPSAPDILLAALNDKRKETYKNILTRLNSLPKGFSN